jgi:catechol 2,3-dioxygenase-like lactoylglutathione lyase family enzyme
VPFVDHVSVGVSDLAASAAFYDRVLAPLGARRLYRDAGLIGYGSGAPNGSFAICRPQSGPPLPQDGAHVCFAAGTRDEVERFHQAALAAGGTDNGGPGYRHRYGPDYFAAFALDPDGNHLGVVARLRPDSQSTPRARILDHHSIGTSDLDEAGRFYDALLAAIEVRRLRTRPDYVMYGSDLTDSTFILAVPDEEQARLAPQPGFHTCFAAPARAGVELFHAAALAAGGRDNGRPGYRPQYGLGYFGAFVLDPWGNRLGVVARVPPEAQ